MPSTVTGKVLTNAQNSVTEAMRELELGSGVVWGDALPSFRDINGVVEQDHRAAELAGDGSAVQPRGTGADDGDVETHAGRVSPSR